MPMTTDSQAIERLLAEARAGDGVALGQLLESYRSYIALLARLNIDERLQGKVSASDMVQETFLHAKRGFSRFRGQTEPELVAWLRRILATQLTELARRYSTELRDIDLEQQLDQSSAAVGQQLAAETSSPSDIASRREQAVLVAQALERLKPSYREVIVLRHLEGLSFSEVARRMDRSVDSVKGLWTRAFCKLRTVLREV